LERHLAQGLIEEIRTFSSDPDRRAEDELWQVLSRPGDNRAAAEPLAQRVRSFDQRRDAARHKRLAALFVSLPDGDRVRLADYRRRHPRLFASFF
jgi:thioredoxin-like negative regulator of GroEL